MCSAQIRAEEAAITMIMPRYIGPKPPRKAFPRYLLSLGWSGLGSAVQTPNLLPSNTAEHQTGDESSSRSRLLRILELESEVHTKVRNHGEGLLVGALGSLNH